MALVRHIVVGVRAKETLKRPRDAFNPSKMWIEGRFAVLKRACTIGQNSFVITWKT
jgi:hypothetical protein